MLKDKMAEGYELGLFQKTYADKCSQIGKPLNKEQTSALEETVESVFGKIKKTEKQISDDIGEKEIDEKMFYELSGGSSAQACRLLNVLKNYTRLSKDCARGSFQDIIIKNKDALRLYGAEGYVKGFGNGGFRLLKRYLAEEGLIGYQKSEINYYRKNG